MSEMDNDENVAEETVDSEETRQEQPVSAVAGEDAAGEISIEEQLAKAQEEVAALKDMMLRTAADSENFKKRMEREKQAALKYAGEDIFRELLPSVDNLERAVTGGVVDGATAEASLGALIEGVEMTLKSLLATLARFEVKPIESAGQPFDPQHHEALAMEASDSVPGQHVISEYEKGYWYKDRLLRPARVIVSSGAEKA